MIVICTESVSRFLHIQVALVSYMKPIDIQSETSSCQLGCTSYWVSVNISLGTRPLILRLHECSLY